MKQISWSLVVACVVASGCGDDEFDGPFIDRDAGYHPIDTFPVDADTTDADPFAPDASADAQVDLPDATVITPDATPPIDAEPPDATPPIEWNGEYAVAWALDSTTCPSGWVQPPPQQDAATITGTPTSSVIFHAFGLPNMSFVAQEQPDHSLKLTMGPTSTCSMEQASIAQSGFETWTGIFPSRCVNMAVGIDCRNYFKADGTKL